MPSYTKQTRSAEFTDIPEDMYVATLEEFREVENKFNPDVPRLMVVYKLHVPDDPELDGRTIAEFLTVTYGFHPQTGAPSKWLQRQAVFCAAQGLTEPDEGEDYATEDYEGARVRITVVHVPKKEGGHYVNVGTVQTMRQAKPRPQPAPKPPAATDETPGEGYAF